MTQTVDSHSIPSTTGCANVPQYHGLRMSADQYLDLPDDGYRYELVDGVVIRSPSPTPRHQAVAMEMIRQLLLFLESNPIGHVLHEVDLVLEKKAGGTDRVYRPDLLFVDRNHPKGRRIEAPVGVVVEVILPDRRQFDLETKRTDYERAGVHEYWLIDPDAESMRFWRLQSGRFLEIRPTNNRFRSEAVPGFEMDLARVREEFHAW